MVKQNSSKKVDVNAKYGMIDKIVFKMVKWNR